MFWVKNELSTFPLNKNTSNKHLETQLIHGKPVRADGFKSLPVPEYRGSSTFFENTTDLLKQQDPLGLDYSYGLHGNPTQYTLAKQLALIEQATHCLIVPSGLNAIAMVAHGVLGCNDHWLIPNNVYGPVVALANKLKKQLKIQYSTYNPLKPESIDQVIQSNTKLLWLEAPGSLTLETPPITALIERAKGLNKEIISAIDNTYSAGLTLKPLSMGCDVSIQALTKHQCGHADVLLGAVLANDRSVFAAIEEQNRVWGVGVSPTDCNMVLRGLLTLPLRYKQQAENAFKIAQWLNNQPAVHTVLHPSLADTPGHEYFRKQFRAPGCLFTVIFNAKITQEEMNHFIDALKLFHIAYSWGGPESLALPVKLPADRKKQLEHDLKNQNNNKEHLIGPLVRFAIGLENTEDLISDLKQALKSYNSIIP